MSNYLKLIRIFKHEFKPHKLFVQVWFLLYSELWPQSFFVHFNTKPKMTLSSVSATVKTGSTYNQY